MRKILTVAMVLAAAGSASAQHTFPSFNLNVGSTISSLNLNGASVPAGSYGSYEVSFDWGGSIDDAWSNEAIWALVDRAAPDNTGTFYADPGASFDSLANSNPVRLTWMAPLDTPYSGGNPLHFWTLQTFGGSAATWSNISITLRTGSGIIAPPSIDLGTLNAGMNMQTGTLSPSGVVWYKFSTADITDPSSFLTIDTFGSTLTGGSFGNGNDTELGLYDSNGALIATNDDADFGAGNLLSFLGFGSAGAADLAGGTYYIALGGFNTTFANNFSATSTSGVNGNYKLTLNTNVPTPAALALFGLAGVAGTRRRRA
jgi:MYXO-CTERM domain-containing protein